MSFARGSSGKDICALPFDGVQRNAPGLDPIFSPDDSLVKLGGVTGATAASWRSSYQPSDPTIPTGVKSTLEHQPERAR
jgi:hypothetical protein